MFWLKKIIYIILFSFALLMEDNGTGFGELFRREYSTKHIPSFPLVMRSRIITCIIRGFAVNLAFASDSEDYVDHLRYVDLQLSAVITDVAILGWLADGAQTRKKVSIKAIYDLNELKNYLRNLQSPQELSRLKKMSLETIDRLQKIYHRIDEKKPEEIKQAFDAFGKFYPQYASALKEALKKYQLLDKLPEDSDPQDKEIKLIQNQQDLDVYLNALKLMAEKKYPQAYEDLNALLSEYQKTPFPDSIMLKMSDCLLMHDSTIKDEEEGIKLLTKIIDKNSYSPVLNEVFFKWRTMTQSFNYGMSNLSKIPNKQYNQKRWKIIQAIKQHLRSNPDDLWAKAQIELLFNLSNIKRGGSMGNNNLMYWGILYANSEEVK